jgi:hypothetical protein
VKSEMKLSCMKYAVIAAIGLSGLCAGSARANLYLDLMWTDGTTSVKDIIPNTDYTMWVWARVMNPGTTGEEGFSNAFFKIKTLPSSVGIGSGGVSKVANINANFVIVADTPTIQDLNGDGVNDAGSTSAAPSTTVGNSDVIVFAPITSTYGGGYNLFLSDPDFQAKGGVFDPVNNLGGSYLPLGNGSFAIKVATVTVHVGALSGFAGDTTWTAAVPAMSDTSPPGAQWFDSKILDPSVGGPPGPNTTPLGEPATNYLAGTTLTMHASGGPVPEPGTLGLLSLATVTMCARRRRA